MRALAEPLRFAAVGLTATAVHVAVGLTLASIFGLAPWAANIAAFVVALVVSYVGNSIVTFRVRAARADAFAKFAFMSGCGFVLNQGIVVALTGLGWTYAAALAVVVAIVPAATFFAAKYWALAERR